MTPTDTPNTPFLCIFYDVHNRKKKILIKSFLMYYVVYMLWELCVSLSQFFILFRRDGKKSSSHLSSSIYLLITPNPHDSSSTTSLSSWNTEQDDVIENRMSLQESQSCRRNRDRIRTSNSARYSTTMAIAYHHPRTNSPCSVGE